MTTIQGDALVRHRPTPHEVAHVSSDTIITCGPGTRFNLTHWGRVLAARYAPLPEP